MGFHVILMFVYFNLMLVATHADLPPELYWKWMLPGTPMPKSITKLLNHGHMAPKETEFPLYVSGAGHAPKETELPLYFPKHEDAKHALKEIEFPLYVSGTEHAPKETELSLYFPKENEDARYAPKETEFPLYFPKKNEDAKHAPKEIEFPVYTSGTKHAPKETEFPLYFPKKNEDAKHAPKENEFPLYVSGAEHAPKDIEFPLYFPKKNEKARHASKETEFPLYFPKKNEGAKHVPKEIEFPLYVYGVEHAPKETEILIYFPKKNEDAKHAPKEIEFPLYVSNAKYAPKETEIPLYFPKKNEDAKHEPKETKLPVYVSGVEHAPKETEFPLYFPKKNEDAKHGSKEIEFSLQVSGAEHAPKETEFPFYYYGAEKSQYPILNEDIFFLEEDIRPGKKLCLHINKSQHAAPLLSRQITEPIPFSANKMKDILNKLSIKPKSENAVIIKKALIYCEARAPGGEEKYCATSLESMVDFVISKLGKNVHAISTEVENNIKVQKIEMKGVKKLEEDNVVVCHRLDYPYVVFLCHKLINTSTYFVPLEAEDGIRAKAIAVCHRDTSNWDPRHLAFRVLNVKPGTTPVCHFTHESTTVWLPK